MLLDDEQAAVNELVAACRESADHYGDAAGQVEDDAALGELFESLRAARLGTVDELCRIVRASGDLPRAAHADKEELDRLVTRVKAVFSGDTRGAFLDARIDDERRLRELAREALQLELADDARDAVERLLARTDDALARLEERRRALPE